MKIAKKGLTKNEANPRMTMHLRMVTGDVTVLGPGKVELLGHIADTGSIAEAARCMGMSYNRAWLHVKIMNDSFKEPLVISNRGGQSRGGASLSPLGEKVVKMYNEMREEARIAIKKSERQLMKLLSEPSDVTGK
jgi:molybdate transport system regulatory protein